MNDKLIKAIQKAHWQSWGLACDEALKKALELELGEDRNDYAAKYGILVDHIRQMKLFSESFLQSLERQSRENTDNGRSR